MERRKTPRISIPKLGYVNFEPYNTGGVITDVSTVGLRFHTVTPVQQGGVVRLSLTLGAANQIDAVGELVWTDSTRTIGGVRFVVLPPTAAEQIENWARANSGEIQSETEATAPGSSLPDSSSESPKTLVAESVGVADKHDAPTVAMPVQGVSPQSTLPEVNPNPRTPWVPPARPYSAASSIGPQSSDAAKGDAPNASTLPSHGFGLPSQPGTMPWITHFDPDPPERTAFARGVIGGVILCLLLAPLAWFGLRRYVLQSSSLWPANPALSNPASAEPNSTPANSVLPAPDLPAPADANSAPPNPPAANPPVPNIDTKSVTAANPALPAEQNPPVGTPSAAPAPNSSANPAAGAVAQSSAPQAKSAAKPGAAAAPDNNEQTQVAEQPPARSPVLANGPRDIAPDSLALASQHVAKTPAPAAAPEPADDGETQLILAWQYLEGQGGKPRDPTAASQLLWSAVQKGNLTAETTLANLYLRGEGVPKNCDQARVLLSAASDKGNAEAKRKLAELNHTGCH